MNRMGTIAGMLFLAMALATRSEGLQYSEADSGVSARLNAVAYSANRFTAVGTNSTTITSSQETNQWQSSNVPTASQNLSAVTFGDGMFVTGGQNSGVFSSTDGINWDSRGSAFGSPAAIKGLAFNNGTFVAVAPSALIRYSTNLQTWTTATIVNPAVLEGYRSVTPFGSNGLALCGLGSVIRVSSDAGRTWRVAGTNSHHSSKPTLLGIASDDRSRLVCVGTGGRIMVSSNGGTNWSIGSSVTTKTLNGVAYTGSGFVAVGDDGLILSSEDGTLWATNSSPTSNDLYGVTFPTNGPCQGMGVLVGANGTVLVGDAPPAAPVSLGDQETCEGNPNPSLKVSVMGPVTVDWFATASGGNPLATGRTNFTPAVSSPAIYSYYAQARCIPTAQINTNRTRVKLGIYGRPIAFLNGETNICSGGQVDIHATLTGAEPFDVVWSDGFSNSVSSSPATRTVSPSATTTYRVIALADRRCAARPADLIGSVRVTVASPLRASAASSTTICAGDSLNLNGFATGGMTSYIYRWSPTNFLSDPNIAKPIARPPPHTSITYTFTVMESSPAHCTAQTNLTLTVNQILTAAVAASETICAESSKRLEGSAAGGTAPYIFRWSPTNFLNNPNIANPVATPPPGTTRTYTLTVTDAVQCVTSARVTVTVNGALKARAVASKTLCAGSSLNLNGSAGGGTGSYTYRWLPTNYLSNPNTNNPVARPPADTVTTYVLTVTDTSPALCTAQTNVTVTMVSSAPAPVSLGDQTNWPAMVSVPAGVTVDWYDAPIRGTRLAANTNSFMPKRTMPGIVTNYAQARIIQAGCTNWTRTAVTVTLEPTWLTGALVKQTNFVAAWFVPYSSRSRDLTILQATTNLMESDIAWVGVVTNANRTKPGMHYRTNRIATWPKQFFRLRLP